MTESRLLNVHEAARAYGCSRSQFYVLIKCGLMVPPLRRGKGGRWPSDEIELINLERCRHFTAAERRDPRPDEQIRMENVRTFVAQLVRERSEADLTSVTDNMLSSEPRAS
jgi:predicted DNA-binding transcriptional regulator AlpA